MTPPMPINVKRKFAANSPRTLGIDLHPSKPWLLTSHLNGDGKIYNLQSGQAICAFTLRPTYAINVKFIAREDWYALGTHDGRLSVFNCSTHERVVAFLAHTDSVRSLAVHPTASIIFTGGSDGTIKAWDWKKGWENVRTYLGHTNMVHSIVFNPKDLNKFASASEDSTVKMWSIAAPIPQFTIKADVEGVNWVDFYPGADKPHLITASDDNTVKVWNYLSQTLVHTMEGHVGNVFFAVFHPSLPIIISGSRDDTVKIWNSVSYQNEHTLRYNLGEVIRIALCKDTSEVALGLSSAVLTIELAHSGPPQMVALKDDMSDEVSKEQVKNLFEGGNVKILASTTPSQSHRTHPQKLELHQQCITAVMELMASQTTNKLISELRGDKAQYVVDFLSKMLSDENTLTQRDRKHTLYFLSKLSKSAGVFPQCLRLKDVRCSLVEPVTSGGYGFIYKGEHEGRSICIKAVRNNSRGGNSKKLRAQTGELIFWGHLSNPNVLPFLGIYSSEEQVSRVCIVSPWMDNGNLLEYLDIVSDVPRKPLVRDIISGLQYLHDLDIIHADLKAENVLVSGSGRAMLADFGISRLSVTRATNLTHVGAGTDYWKAPELLLDYEPHSRASDIWAFACTCYEVLTGEPPFSEHENAQRLKYAFKHGNVTPEEPEELGSGWDEDVWSLAVQCWRRDPASRPEAQELLDTINNFNFVDDRPSDPESQRKMSYQNIDYDQVLSILNEIRQSAAV